MTAFAIPPLCLNFPCREAPAAGGAGAAAGAGGAAAGGGVPALPPAGPDQGFHRFVASGYALHHLESPTGYRFALTTDPGVQDMRAVLWHIYSELFVGYALKNPAYVAGSAIDSVSFIAETDRFVRSLPAFSSK